MLIKVKIFNVRFGISLYKDGKEEVMGYTNRCADGRYIICLDYDGMDYEWIVQELSYMIKDYKLGDFYIFNSSIGSYHAVCCSKVPLSLLKEIMYNASIDIRQLTVPLNMGKKLITLRITEKNKKKESKIKLLTTIKGMSVLKESYEHKELLFKLGLIEDFDKSNTEFVNGEVIVGRYKI